MGKHYELFGDVKGGSGICPYCKEFHSNVSLHAAWHCKKNPDVKSMKEFVDSKLKLCENENLRRKCMKVKVEGMGTFEVSEEFIPQLMSWLSSHSGVKLGESNTVFERNGNSFTGRELLNG